MSYRETVVVKAGDSSPGVFVGVVAIIIVLALGWYFLMGPGAATNAQSNDTNVTVVLPSVEAPAPS